MHGLYLLRLPLKADSMIIIEEEKDLEWVISAPIMV
jgi:hypothetical protein